MREAIRVALAGSTRVAVVGEASCARDALGLLQSVAVDVAIVDYGLPDLNGARLTAKLRESTSTRVLMFSCHSARPYVREAVRSGVAGYLSKADTDAQSLVEAVLDVAAGHPVFSEEALVSVASCVRDPLNRVDQMTVRETEVWRLMARGLNNKQIAERLFITERTVKFHVSHILSKIDVSSRSAAVACAYTSGLMGQEADCVSVSGS
ncbi:MAG: response regulator transcription factor [Coriobacteriia bacterium]|nr:response regulator transcription factor [Coriobacteriia bacterium]